MAAYTGYQMYQNTQYEGLDPKRLILMLYDGALRHLRLAGEGIEENNVQKRGENLGKAIAIISELHSCLDTSVKDESVDFVKGLYGSILAELPKVSLTNDVLVVKKAANYINRLKEIWENEVMEAKTKTAYLDKTAGDSDNPVENNTVTASYGREHTMQGRRSFCV